MNRLAPCILACKRLCMLLLLAGPCVAGLVSYGSSQDDMNAAAGTIGGSSLLRS